MYRDNYQKNGNCTVTMNADCSNTENWTTKCNARIAKATENCYDTSTDCEEDIDSDGCENTCLFGKEILAVNVKCRDECQVSLQANITACENKQKSMFAGLN